MSNHATKRGLKNAAGIDLSSFAKKVDLANLNSYVDKLDIDKLKNLPTNLNNFKSKLDKLDVDKSIPVHIDLGNFIFIELSEIFNSFVKIRFVLEIKNVASFIKTRFYSKRGCIKVRKHT